MNFEQYLPYLVQFVTTIFGFSFVLGRYKSVFDNHEKILDSHEKVIDGLLNRLDKMNSEIHYVKGFVSSKKQE